MSRMQLLSLQLSTTQDVFDAVHVDTNRHVAGVVDHAVAGTDTDA